MPARERDALGLAMAHSSAGDGYRLHHTNQAQVVPGVIVAHNAVFEWIAAQRRPGSRPGESDIPPFANHAAFSDFSTTILDQIAEGDRVVTRRVTRGSQSGTWVGLMGQLGVVSLPRPGA